MVTRAGRDCQSWFAVRRKAGKRDSNGWRRQRAYPHTAPERGSVSRSTSMAGRRGSWFRHRFCLPPAAGHRPALRRRPATFEGRVRMRPVLGGEFTFPVPPAPPSAARNRPAAESSSKRVWHGRAARPCSCVPAPLGRIFSGDLPPSRVRPGHGGARPT